MPTLIVAATAAETAPLVRALGEGRPIAPRLVAYARRGRELHLLTTGVGMVATAAWASRALAAVRYQAALNLGLCGSFDRALPPGSVVHVVSDCLAELGAEDGERFLPIDELGLQDRDDPRLGARELANAAPPANPALDRLPRARGITVSTAHGDERTIADTVARLGPQVESMEGAAFVYACLIHEVPFAQVRAVSNVVERRNRAAWRVGEAIDALAAAALAIVDAS